MARGLALAAMTVFHFAFDLELFGYLEPGFIAQTEWKWFARLIAGSFLFLVGFCVILAHETTIRWRKFAIRFGKVTTAAAAITLATWFATPDTFIFFGILHAIALYSVLAMVLVRAPAAVLLAACAVLLFAGPYFASDNLNAPYWWWSGLSTIYPRTSDYVPMFPWAGIVVGGMASARLRRPLGISALLAHTLPTNAVTGGLGLIGRHSLIYYLAHQPILIACLLGYGWLAARIG